MFVPFVGHLFTCDSGSTMRYTYYNNLEKNRRAKIYKQLIKNKNENLIKRINQTLYDEDNEDNDDDDDDEEEEEDENDDEEIGDDTDEKSGCQSKHAATSKSDNDLRVKKSVTFIPHANTTINISKVSPSSTITTNTAETSTSSPSSSPTTPNAPTTTENSIRPSWVI